MVSGQWEEGKNMAFPFSVCCKLLGNTTCYLRTALWLSINTLHFFHTHQ